MIIHCLQLFSYFPDHLTISSNTFLVLTSLVSISYRFNKFQPVQKSVFASPDIKAETVRYRMIKRSNFRVGQL